MKIKLVPAEDYTNPFKCPIAKGLRRKGIFASVGPNTYSGVFLFLIPVWEKYQKKPTRRLISV